MPIDVEVLEDADGPPVKPDTNEHAVMQVLADHPDKAFSTSELVALTDVAAGSLSKSLSRLESKGLVRKIHGYWSVADDAVAQRVAGVLSLRAIETRYGDDRYGGSVDWVDELPDLGENA